MQGQIITNIRHLVNVRTSSHILRGTELADCPVLVDAYLHIAGGMIQSTGLMRNLNIAAFPESIQVVDAKGASVLPAWCDSHTHLVFAASRESEFVDKIKGMSYAEIAAKGGGILNSARKLNETPEDRLYELALERLHELICLGTGAIEIKSGYGLTIEGELKMLRVIQRLKAVSPIPVKATFLGAHAYPEAYRQDHEG